MENTEKKTDKLTPKEWWENIWYHYKWILIFGMLIAVFLLYSLVQCTASKDPDVNIMHVGPMLISSASADQIESTLAGLSEDYNDDGAFKLDLLDITVNKFGNSESSQDPINYDHNNSGLQRFQTEIRAGDAYIYLLDEEFFKICVEEGLLTKLDSVIDDADMPENVIDGYGVKLSELDAYSLPGLSSVPEGAILCLRRSPEYDELKYERTVEAWEGNRCTFVNIIKYRSESK